MATWADATKNASTFTYQNESGAGGGTISQGIKFMGHIMQYSEDIIVVNSAPVWTNATKN